MPLPNFGIQIHFIRIGTKKNNQMDNNGEFVDLGLSVKWATSNIGANKPEESGDYIAWGETEPKDSYLLDNYKLSVKVDSWIDVDYSKYNVKPDAKNKNVVIKGKIDNLKILELDDDAAHKALGGGWAHPNNRGVC